MARRSQAEISTVDSTAADLDAEFILQSLGVHDTDGRPTVEDPDGLMAALGDDDVLTVFPDGTAVLSANQPISVEDYQEQIVEGHHPLLGKLVTFDQDGTTYRGILVDIAPPESNDEGTGVIAMRWRTGFCWYIKEDTEEWGAPILNGYRYRKFCHLKELKEIP